MEKKGLSNSPFFLWIPSPELAIARIKDRVAEGGHHVPAADVRRRFVCGVSNFIRHESTFDTWMLFNNSMTTPALIAMRLYGNLEVMDNQEYFKIIGKWVELK